MSIFNKSGSTEQHGNEPHPFFKRVVDRLPPGRLLLLSESVNRYAVYAAEAGWRVHAIGFSKDDQERTLALADQAHEKNISFSLYQPNTPFCQGLEFDAAVLMYAQLPPDIRRSFHQAVVNCLKPDGGNLYLLAYSENQPENTTAYLPDVRYRKADLMEDFTGLQIDLLQEEEETLPDTDQKVSLIHLTAVRNSEYDGSDSVSFSVKG
ncbi:SAM-dependent methyltransferase [Flammeovirgaceae bacterium 311]|nr:SAM-dependent methyltransferase [Flammeovirgaceae bacterium 311]